MKPRHDIYKRVWDFSVDEGICLIVATAIVVVRFFPIFIPLFGARAARRGAWKRRLALVLTILIALMILGAVLRYWADPVNVVGHLDYQILFFMCGFAWIILTITAMPIVGYSVRDDAIERDNPAAVAVACGAVLGFMLSFAGANIGYGPTIWTTLLPAMLAFGILFLAWLAFEFLTRAAEAVTIDRDIATGLRVAGLLVSCGAILGRTVAGDWMGWDALWRDLERFMWPVAGIVMLSVVFNVVAKPTPLRPSPPVFMMGVVPLLVCIALSAGFILHTGRPAALPPALWRDVRSEK
ncbi:MAG TPA: hypothetical protein VFE47_06280 [Tepidisphaeraceae bacterium]|jgi:uncharacterized membrane protein YjfL (UPF0719 family)|nr:hypothetical protein [Tepidisphaeraceae bacterium]